MPRVPLTNRGRLQIREAAIERRKRALEVENLRLISVRQELAADRQELEREKEKVRVLLTELRRRLAALPNVDRMMRQFPVPADGNR